MQEPRVSIFPVGQTEPELRKTLPDWFQREFGQTGFTWTAPAYYTIAEVEGELTGRPGIFDRKVDVACISIPVGGIGGVITKPEWRRRGIAREVASVYAKFGWIRVDGPTVFMQPSGLATYPRHTMVLSFAARQWPIGSIDMCGLPW
jgi:hypothetical protein